MRKVLGVTLPRHSCGTAASGKHQPRKRQMSSRWLEIRVIFSAQRLALAKAQHKLVASLLAIIPSLGLFPGMEALVSMLSHTASFQVTVATCKLPLGMLHHLS